MIEIGIILAEAIASYLKTETNSKAGRLNLALCVVLGLFAFFICVPTLAALLIRAFLFENTPGWVWGIPFASFVIVAIVGYGSYIVIPKAPADWSEQ